MLPKFLRPAPKRPAERPGPKATPLQNAGAQAQEAGVGVVGWLDERTGASPFLRGFLFRKVPKGTNWFYTLGSATMFAFVSQAVTGVFLAMYYEPDPTPPTRRPPTSPTTSSSASSSAACTAGARP